MMPLNKIRYQDEWIFVRGTSHKIILLPGNVENNIALKKCGIMCL